MGKKARTGEENNGRGNDRRRVIKAKREQRIRKGKEGEEDRGRQGKEMGIETRRKRRNGKAGGKEGIRKVKK